VRSRGRFFWVGAGSALTLIGSLIVAAPSGAQAAGASAAARGAVAAGAPVRLTAQAVPVVPWGAALLGPLAAGTRLHLDVTLKVRDQAALTGFLADLSNRASPLFHHFLKPGQFGPRFGPTLATVAAVRAALRDAGLTPGKTASNRLAIPVTATAASVEHAFRIQLDTYRLPGGRTAYTSTASPAIAAGVARYVIGVIGLDNLYPERSLLATGSPARPAGQRRDGVRLPAASDTSGPKPCSAAKSVGEYTANQLASYYYMSPFYALRDLGSGVRVALLELESNSTSDISAYEKCYGVSTSVSYKKVDGGAGSGPGSSPEAALDIEDIIGLAPDVSIDVYQGPDTGTGILDTYNAIVTADKDAVVSTSWGGCEALTSDSFAESEQDIFAQANSQGQTVFAAAGDTGSTGCLREGADDSTLSAGDPSSQPYVIGVGGTSIPKITSPTEKVWNDSNISNGAGGGGISTIWCMPGYQHQTAIPGLINSHSVKNSGCSSSVGKYVREDPDVSADADPQTGYAIFWKGNWGGVGGTSAAAPLWAAVAALIDDSPFCADYGSGDVGVYPQGLWRVVALDHSYIYTGGKFVPEILKDITSGNNDYTPSGYTGGLYPATAGYDLASGLGSPLVSGLGEGDRASMFYPGLAAAMCGFFRTKLKTDSLTSISPTSGSTGGGTTVTIRGTGFLPIAGADEAEVGSTLVAATCTSTTKCTIKMPKHKAGSVSIRMSVEDGLFTKAKTFTYKS
jgi:hypothetical protein